MRRIHLPEFKISIWLPILTAAFVLKSWFIVTQISSMTVFLDEVFYFAAAYDVLHFGAPGVPHPQFLFYPPGVSLVTAPVHLFGLGMPLTYQLSLILLNLILSSCVVAGCGIFRELFGRDSWLLFFVLLLSSPAYLGSTLMSESLFVPLYIWHLYFFVRFFKRRKGWDAALAGLFGAAMIWTRPNGLGILVATLVSILYDFFSQRPVKGSRLASCGLLIGIPCAGYAGWKLLHHRLADATNWNFSLGDYLGWTLEKLAAAPLEVIPFMAKVVSNLIYVSLSTYGMALPVVVLFVFTHRRSARRPPLGSFLVHVSTFALVASIGAALHMFVYGVDNKLPRYEIYGRYVEYFVVPLWVAAIGALSEVGGRMARHRHQLLAGTCALAALSAFLVPWSYFQSPVSGKVLSATPNHPGIAWLLKILDWFGETGLILAVFAMPMLSITALSIGSRGASKGWRVAVGSALLAAMLVNASLAQRQTALRSKMLKYSRSSHCLDFISDHRERFQEGFYLDTDSLDQKLGKDHLLAMYVDHIDLAIMGKRPHEYLGKIPVVTRRRFFGHELLCHDTEVARPFGGIKIYGAERPLLPEEVLIFGDGFENAGAAAWSGRVP